MNGFYPNGAAPQGASTAGTTSNTGGTSVSADLTGGYVVRQAVAKDLSSAFAVRTSVDASLAGAYQILRAVSADLTGVFSVAGVAVDISKVSVLRIVPFEGTGSRLVVF